jgi:CheY-like chemotaxis protein
MSQQTKGTVLIIEDNILNLDMACELLEMDGFSTLRAEDSFDGIRLARKNHPDLILMDLHLPFQDGFVTTKTLKMDPDLKDIPIVAFTALAMREDQEKAINHGCSGIISKPIDVNSFAKTIEGFLQQSHEYPETVIFSNNTPQAELEEGSSESHKAKKQTSSEDTERFNSSARFISTRETARPEEISAGDIMTHTVMVVDDNAMNVELLKDTLESMGQNVIPAYSGQTAIKYIHQADEQPDLILLDIMMPDMDGYEVLNTLKKNPKTAEIPVIFISALNKTQDMVRGFKEGTYDYITKPFKIEEVKARILASLRIKDLQDILRRERDKLSTIFRFSADGIALLGRDMEVLSANPRFGHWFSLHLSAEGLPENPINFFELLGCQCAENYPCPLHSEEPLILCLGDEMMENTNKQNQQKLVENAIITDKNGEKRFLNIHCGRVKGYGQKLGGYVVVLRDVTEEKSIQKSKETFVATLTHDLKTPIRAEYQALELLMSESFGPIADEQKDILKEIILSNRYMSRLVDSLLTTYMYEEGKIELKLELTDLNALIRSEVNGPLTTLASEKSQSLVLELDEALPPIWFDPIEIHRVLNNLLQNAITYTPDGGTIYLKTYVQDGKVWVAVKDTGQGIEPENLEILFDRYKSMAKKFQQVGTGLGLYLSQKIINAHGGEIGVESELGNGSCFFFSLAMPQSDENTENPPLPNSSTVISI